MSDDQQSIIFEQVSLLSDRFSRDWDTDQVPKIEEYLQRLPPDVRPTLLRNLLIVEVNHRRQNREEPSFEEYAKRFPEDTSLIRQVFDCSLTVNLHARAEKVDTSRTDDPLPLTADFSAPPARQLGNYLLVKELGRGGFGVVWEAEHVEQRYRVALKMLPARLSDSTSSPDGKHLQRAASQLHKFRQEYRRLRDINHPNLVGMQELEEDGNQWFFTMDLVRGIDFLSFVRPEGSLNEERLRSAAKQLVAGVSELHRRGILHRDLKPSNVMVTHDGRVVILDFGLVLDADRSKVSQEQLSFAGTPDYAAPEQLDSHPSPACDWYAVGVMLYEALAGRRPYSHSDPYQLLVQKATKPPAEMIDKTLPEDLVAIAQRLLAANPEERPTGSELAETLRVDGLILTEIEDRLFGRDAELAELGIALGDLQTNVQPLSLFVSGLSGEGKSALVEHFLRPLRRDNRFIVLSGRCYDRESVPFKALDSVIDSLCSQLNAMGDEAVYVLPDDIAFLAKLFPVIQRVDAVSKTLSKRESIELDDKQVRQRAFAALRTLLQRVGREKPILLFVDDLQWGDKASAHALFKVLSGSSAPPILFLGSYRADEVETSEFLNLWSSRVAEAPDAIPTRKIRLRPLDDVQCRQVIEAILEESVLSDLEVQELITESAGNPFLLTELAACVDASAGRVQRIPLSELIDRKLQSLPAEAESLLRMVSIAGQAMQLQEAFQALSLDAQVIPVVTRMRNERLVRLSGTSQKPIVDTYHDKLRENVLERLDSEVKHREHLQLAEVIEQTDEPLSEEALNALHSGELISRTHSRVFDLAYHFDKAGDRKRCLAYALLAARQARSQFALESAIEQYDVVKGNFDQPVDSLRFEVAKGSGDAQMMIGRYEEAASEFAEALELTEQPLEKAIVELAQGEVGYKRGQILESIAAFESGLRRLGSPAPRSMAGYALQMMREAVRQTAHTWMPSRLHRKTADERQRVIASVLTRVAGAYAFTNVLKMIWAQLRAMNQAELYPPSSELALCYAFHAGTITFVGMGRRGLKYAQKVVKLRADLDDPWGMGHGHTWNGVGLYSTARYEDAVEALESGIEAFARTGDVWELNMARFHLAASHYRLGNFSEAAQNVMSTFHAASSIGDTRSHCSLFMWSRMTEGQLPFPQLDTCFTKVRDEIMATCNYMVAKARWELAQGDFEGALTTLESAWRLAVKNLMVNFHTIATLTWMVTTLRLQAEDLRSSNPAESKRISRRALKLARRAAWLTRLYPCDHPHALREYALMLAANGRKRKALRIATKSCAIAQSQKAKYEHAQSALVCAELRRALGESEEASGLEEANQRMAEFQSQIQSVVEQSRRDSESRMQQKVP